MENLKINYVCLALSILCLLLVSCKDDEAYPYPAGKELLNYRDAYVHNSWRWSRTKTTTC